MMRRGGTAPPGRGIAREIDDLLSQIGQDNVSVKGAFIGHNFRMPEPCALIGYEKVNLHWEQALSELGHYDEATGFYPYVIYQTEAFRWLGIARMGLRALARAAHASPPHR